MLTNDVHSQRFNLLLLIAVFAYSCFGASACLAAPDLNQRVEKSEKFDHDGSTDKATSLRAIDRQIMLELIKMARFNVQFHYSANAHWPWRSLLYPLEQSAGTSLSLSRSVVDLDQRVKGFYDPSLKSKTALRNGDRAGLIGTAIGGGSSALELAQNVLADLISRRKGYSPQARIDYVKKSSGTVNALLAEREKIVRESETSEQETRIRTVEGILLRHIFDQIIVEFRKWSTHSEEVMAQQNASYLIDSLQNFAQVGGYAVILNSSLGPARDGAAAITNVSANTLAAFNPTISYAARLVARVHHRHQLNTALPGTSSIAEQPPIQWSDEISRLVATGAEDNDIREIAFLGERSDRADTVITRELDRVQKLRRVAAQQSVTAPIVGTLAIANSICAIVGYYGYRDEPVVRNRIGLGGRISALTGQSYSLLNTQLAQIRNFRYHRRLKEQGQLPAQVLQMRLDRLDALEKRILSDQF